MGYKWIPHFAENMRYETPLYGLEKLLWNHMSWKLTFETIQIEPYTLLKVMNQNKPNGLPFGSQSRGKLSPRSYSFQFERNYKNIWKNIFRKVYVYDLIGLILMLGTICKLMFGKLCFEQLRISRWTALKFLP